MEAQGVILGICEHLGISLKEFFCNEQIARNIIRRVQAPKLKLDFGLKEPEENLWQGLIAVNKGNFIKAKQLLQKSLELRPNIITAYHLSRILYDMGEYEESFSIHFLHFVDH